MMKKSVNLLEEPLFVARDRTRTKFSHKPFLSLSSLRARVISCCIESEDSGCDWAIQHSRLRRPILAKACRDGVPSKKSYQIRSE